MKEDILSILMSIHPEVDYDHETNLIGGRIFDSFDVVTLVGELVDNFDIEVTAEHMIPDNFNSLDAICALVEKLSEE